MKDLPCLTRCVCSSDGCGQSLFILILKSINKHAPSGPTMVMSTAMMRGCASSSQSMIGKQEHTRPQIHKPSNQPRQTQHGKVQKWGAQCTCMENLAQILPSNCIF